ncbi:MAG: putative transcriptional regulator [Saprospiraceae bacterium]
MKGFLNQKKVMKSNNNLLTPLELKVMNVLWKIKKGFVNDILSNWDADDDDKQPAYNTVSTIVRILKDKKQFVGHKAYGRSHEYFPLILKKEYQTNFLDNAVDNLFAGSFSSLVSTFVNKDNISENELEALKKLIEEKTNQD